MAILDLAKVYDNALESKMECTSKEIQFSFVKILDNDEKYNPSTIVLTDGDILRIGHLPKYSYCTDITIMCFDGFDPGTTFDLSFIGDHPNNDLVLIKDAIKVDATDVSIKVPLPKSGVFDTEGVLSEVGGIWNEGVRILPLSITVHSSGELTKGRCRITFSYSTFVPNTGNIIS